MPSPAEPRTPPPAWSPAPQGAPRSCLDDTALWALLREDVPHGDLSTEVLGLGGRPGRMRFRARHPMTLCGLEEAARLLGLLGCAVEATRASGQTVDAGTALLEARGRSEDLLQGWKVAQNLIEWSAGVATAAAAMVAAARAASDSAVVACTRKSVPGTKALSIKAVRCGGARMHRLGLSESLLVFPAHLALLGGSQTPEALVARMRALEPEKKIVVEVEDPAAALRWARAGADVLQLEKFTPTQVAAVARDLAGTPGLPVLAAAGGIDADNAAEYVRAGAAVLVSSAPYAARPRDVAVHIAPA